MQRASMRRGAVVAAVVVAVVGVAVLLVVHPWESGEDRPPTFAEAVQQLTDGTSEPIAIVNGVEIPRAFVDMDQALRRSMPEQPDSAMAQQLDAALVDSLIQRELLYQEAERRGIDPGEDEILERARHAKAEFERLVEGDDGPLAYLRDAYASIEGSPYHPAADKPSPEMFENFRRQLAITKVSSAIAEEASIVDENFSSRKDAVDAVVARLIESATIERFD